METDINKQDNKLRNLIIIIVILAVVSAGVYYWYSQRSTTSNAPVITIETLQEDFQNDDKVITPAVLPPDEIKTGIEAQLQAYKDDIVSEEAIEGGNPYSGYLGVANTYRQLGDLVTAEAEYKRMIGKYPDDYLVWHNLGVLYEDMHLWLDAARSYSTSIEKKSIEPLAHLKLADLYRKHSLHPEKTKDVYLKALQDTQNNENVLRAFADYLERYEKNDREALLYWEQILEQKPDDMAVSEKVSELKEKLGTE